MKNINQYFIYSPGGEDEGSTPADSSDNEEITGDEKLEKPDEKKPLGEKIHDALQDWSNKDQADQEFDDTRV